MTKPLTPEQERTKRAIRDAIARIYKDRDIIRGLNWQMQERMFEEDAADILATLDAARAAAPSGEDHGNPDHPMKQWDAGWQAAFEAIRSGDPDAIKATGLVPPAPDRVCLHGVDTSEECPECGFDFVPPAPDRAGLRKRIEALPGGTMEWLRPNETEMEWVSVVRRDDVLAILDSEDARRG